MIRFNKAKTYSLFTFVRLAIVLSINAFWDALNSLEVLQSYLGFFKVLLCSPVFSWVFPCFPGFSCILQSPVLSCVLLEFHLFSWVLLWFHVIFWVLLGSPGFSCDLLCSLVFSWVVLGCLLPVFYRFLKCSQVFF